MARAGSGAVVLRSTAAIRHLKSLFYGGLNKASGNFGAGANVRIRTEGRKVRR